MEFTGIFILYTTMLYTRVGPYLLWNDFITTILVSTVAAWS